MWNLYDAAVVAVVAPAVVAPWAEDWVQRFRGDERLLHVRRLPARPASFGDLARPLPAAVEEALGVGALWSHQAEAVDLLRDGRSVVIASGTGSGKSLCYQAVIAEAVTAPVRPRTGLLLFPTKALAHDQARAMSRLGLRRMVAATYDGDASPEERAWIRNRANVVLTNPEMLHHGILPHHSRWATFLSRLAYVVVDELHVLRGIFGSHVAHVLRRLRRLCAHYGASPTFVFASATMGQPEVLARSLSGLDVCPVTGDGSPQGDRHFLLWNPPLVDGAGTRASAPAEAAGLAASLVECGQRTIVFSRSRKGAELLAADVQRRLPDHLAMRVSPYRGGYLAEERREIEEALAQGEVDGVVATSALELGIDVHGLDACVLTGFPGTIASMWQQAGRAGRSSRNSVAVLVAGDDQLDQWLARHPEELFARRPEAVVVNPANPSVLLPHLECAASELPLTLDDTRFWPDELDEGVRRLALGDRLVVRRRGRRGEPVGVWAGSGWPSHQVGLRSSSRAEVSIIDEAGQRVGTVDEARAANLVHPGAVYLHQGAVYEVLDLDLEARLARVRPTHADSYTVARTSTSFTILGRDASRAVGRARLELGPLEVRSQVTGYQRFDTRTRESLGTEALDLPPAVLLTRGVWYMFGDELVGDARLGAERLPGALHALEHAAIGLLPLFAICDRWDVGGVSTALQADTGLPTVTIYDGYAGGAGIAELAFDAADRHLGATRDAIAACPCGNGCPSCVQSPKCGNGNEPLDKAGARALGTAVLGRP
ncbi:MAG: DEAD/DEAH box helicase [Acidimicrobiia bacterium]|nr:DEAD/DEAH box helicase [Acidimicrobiia bacterium]